jgi:chromosome segregation ATPase
MIAPPSCRRHLTLAILLGLAGCASPPCGGSANPQTDDLFAGIGNLATGAYASQTGCLQNEAGQSGVAADLARQREAEAQAQLAAKRGQLAAMQSDVARMQRQIDALEAHSHRAQAAGDAQSQTNYDLQNELTRLQLRVSNLKLSLASSDAASDSRYTALRQQYDALKHVLDNLVKDNLSTAAQAP